MEIFKDIIVLDNYSLILFMNFYVVDFCLLSLFVLSKV